MENLTSLFSALGSSETSINLILSKFTPEELPKESLFIRQNEVSSKIAFLNSGICKHYFNNENGTETTIFIATDNCFISSISSFLNKTPSLENIEAISDCSLYTITKDDLNLLLNKIPEFKDIYIKLIEEQIKCLDTSRFDLLTLTPEQRYNKFCKEQPNIIQKVPLKTLASIFGITPRHLSRIRKK